MQLKRFGIKNYKLTLLALLLIGIFIALGNWQLSRARQKEFLLLAFHQRTANAPLSVNELNQPNKDLRFYRVNLHGRFDNQHTFLLDNKIQDGKVGYEVYTPFKADGLPQPILIDRGFIAAPLDRSKLPQVPVVSGKTAFIGLINLPPRYVALGEMTSSPVNTWPLRIEFIHLSDLSLLLGAPLYPYIVALPPRHPAALDIQWQITTMSPERHRAYAVQWFAFALTLLILSVVLNYDRSR